MFCSPWKAWYELSKIPVSVGRAPYLERGSLIPKVTSLKNWLCLLARNEGGAQVKQGVGQSGTTFTTVASSSGVTWCQGRWMRLVHQHARRGGSSQRDRGDGVGAWDTGDRGRVPGLGSFPCFIHCGGRWRARDYVVPPSTTLISQIPEVPFFEGSA